jgi:hypothetical protein
MAESNSPQESSEAEDDTKRKFREALDRKMAKSSGVADHKDGGGKQSRVHGPAESRREFRRKSG